MRRWRLVVRISLTQMSSARATGSAELLCAFPMDAGTGGHWNGRCSGHARETAGVAADSGGNGRSPAYTGVTLRDALEQQHDGSFRRAHPGASLYNEVAIGWRYWEDHLPWAIEAFAFSSADDKYDGLHAIMAPIHQAFLAEYGLTAAEVPLLRYLCSQNDPMQEDRWANTPRAAECWQDVS